MYIVSLKYKTRFKNFDFFILSENVINKISKTIIFVNKIENPIQIVKNLHLRLLKCI